MAMSKIWDLSYEVDGDSIYLEQDAGIGEVHRMELHSIHLRLLATEAGLLKGNINAWERVETLERRLSILVERIEELDAQLRSVPVFPPGSRGDDPELMLSGFLVDLGQEFVADFPSVGLEESHQVTPSHTSKRGTKRDPEQAGLALEDK